ncbi:response regulator [Metabacillus sp. GX 13764]|uniref:response regulator transcription factor n=1 Tax=Metabacillus kandeliae TaxID=2900151 RepID=UPI001E5F856F|nr:response regulator [Metabacillus kandeliae]MCD7034368.1 response regulator [Metabacillus kandeliae]
MMKVVISDDEAQIRKGLRMKVNWEEEGFEIVDEASNGKEALEILGKMQVDLVITDMRMPIMDGIEFARRCHMEHPKVKVIVLSGYSDFGYVRGSLKEGVKDYLLKPVAPDDLEEALRKIKKEAEEEKQKEIESARIRRLAYSQLGEVQEQFLLQFVKGEYIQPDQLESRMRHLQLEELLSGHARIQFVTAEIRDQSGSSERIRELWLPFRMLCKEIAGGHKGTYSFYDPGCANMVQFMHLIQSVPLDRHSPLIKAIQQHTKKYLNLETVIGIGNEVNSLLECKTGYISSLLSWSGSQLAPESQIIDGKFKTEELAEFSPEMERKLTNAIENASMEGFKKSLHSIFERADHQSILSFSFDANRVLFLLSAMARKYSVDSGDVKKSIWHCQQSIWELNSQKKVLEHLIHLAQRIIEKVRTARFSNGKLIVDSVRNYVDQHYAHEITLASLSDLFHINNAYLSEVFKNHVGQNFSDYLVQLRLEKARNFLKDKELKIIDVANLSGFSSSAYFSTVFKKHFNQTPVEFRSTAAE